MVNSKKHYFLDAFMNSDYIKNNKNFIKYFLNNDVKFNAFLANSHSVSFKFNKNKRLDLLFKEQLASDLLITAFLKLGCLISKPTFSIVSNYEPISYSKAIKDKIMENYSEEAIMDIENSHKFIQRNKQKIIIRVLFYVRDVNRCYNNKYSRKLEEQTIVCTSENETSHTRNSQNQLQTIANKVSRQFNFLEIYKMNLTYLVKELSTLLDANVKLELVQLKRPFHNSEILSKYLNLSSFSYKFVQLINKLLKKIRFSHHRNYRNMKNSETKLNLEQKSIISGVKLRLGGRTHRQKIIPRKTVQQIQRGSLANDKVSLLETSLSRGKTRRGAYSFSVRLGHIILQ